MPSKEIIEFREKELLKFKEWFLEEKKFLSLIFDNPKLRMSIEYIPSFLLTCLKSKGLKEDVLEDDSSFNLFQLSFRFLKGAIDELKVIYNKLNQDLNKLGKLSDAIYLYFSLKDVFIALEEKQINYPDKLKDLPDFYLKFSKKILNGENISTEDLKKATQMLEDAFLKLEDFCLLNDFIAELTLDLNIPVHNLDL